MTAVGSASARPSANCSMPLHRNRNAAGGRSGSDAHSAVDCGSRLPQSKGTAGTRRVPNIRGEGGAERGAQAPSPVVKAALRLHSLDDPRSGKNQGQRARCAGTPICRHAFAWVLEPGAAPTAGEGARAPRPRLFQCAPFCLSARCHSMSSSRSTSSVLAIWRRTLASVCRCSMLMAAAERRAASSL